MNQFEMSQNVWQQVQQLGALCATPGVDEETIKQANDLIRKLLEVVKPLIQKMSATSSGILVN